MGRYALSGVQSMNGVRLAVLEVNRKGGVHGRRIHLLEYRTGSYVVDVRRAAALAAAQGALAIIGSNSSELSRAVAEEAEARGLVQVSNVSTAHDLTWDPVSGRDRAFVFRVCSSDAQMGAQLARFTVGTLGARRAAVLFEVGRSYSTQLARSFIETFRSEVSPASVTELRYLTQETDFRPQLREALTVRPDVLFVPGSFTDATLVASQAVSVGLAATLVGADGWSNPLLFSRGAPPGPAWFVDLCEPKEDYALRYREAFGAEAYGCRAMLASDALRSVVVALQAMGVLEGDALGPDLPATRKRLRDELATAEVDGETGRFRFDANGDRRRGVVLFSVEARYGGSRTFRTAGWLGTR
jgi:branched-chain amino acid transport system substrate-binding protein